MALFIGKLKDFYDDGPNAAMVAGHEEAGDHPVGVGIESVGFSFHGDGHGCTSSLLFIERESRCFVSRAKRRVSGMAINIQQSFSICKIKNFRCHFDIIYVYSDDNDCTLFLP